MAAGGARIFLKQTLCLFSAREKLRRAREDGLAKRIGNSRVELAVYVPISELETVQIDVDVVVYVDSSENSPVTK